MDSIYWLGYKEGDKGVWDYRSSSYIVCVLSGFVITAHRLYVCCNNMLYGGYCSPNPELLNMSVVHDYDNSEFYFSV